MRNKNGNYHHPLQENSMKIKPVRPPWWNWEKKVYQWKAPKTSGI